MAYSYVQYTGNGTTTNYTFPFIYLSQDHIKVRLDGVLTNLFSFINANTIQLFSAPAAGVVIEIRRETPKDNPIVNFTDGSVLLERDLDLLATFDLYIAQEATDLASDVMSRDTTGQWDAESDRIRNIANPIDDGDAVNKGTLGYEYPAVQTVAGSINNVNVVGSDLGVASALVTDLGSVADAVSPSTPGGTSKISTVATNIADVQLVADNIVAIQGAITSASSAAASAASASSSASSATASASSATASASSATSSAAAALASKNAAETAETNAAASSASASSSASTATTKAGEASASASAAAASQAAASSSATSASGSASTATTQASNASASAVAAAASQSASATSAANAATSESNALSYKNTAQTAATNAGTSEANALAAELSANEWATKTSGAVAGGEFSAKYHAQAASTSASSASSSASTATTQATNAASSATAAAASASDAASSAASAAALLDNFDDRYLGPKASAPTLDNDGNALVVGALYFDTTSGKMRVYTASGWVDASSASQAALTIYRYTATASQTTFSGADDNAVTLAYLVGGAVITLNGVVLVGSGIDYTASNGTSVVLTSGATAGDILEVYAFSSFSIASLNGSALVDGTVTLAKLTATLDLGTL